MDVAAAYAVLAAESMVWAYDAARFDALIATVASERPAARRGGGITAALAGGGGAAVIPVFGPLTAKPNFLSSLFGASTYLELGIRISEAAATPEVRKIILWVDSPGGSAAGLPELADQVAKAGRVKPVVAVVDTLAASAAYWIASQAGMIVVTRSAEVGSIGVFALHVDSSKALDRAGLKPTFVVSRQSPHKVEGNPFEPLSGAARAWTQAQVDAIGSEFVAAVARGRGVTPAAVVSRMGGGRTLRVDAARPAGMVDAIGTLETALRLGGRVGVSGGREGSASLPGPPLTGEAERRRRRLMLEQARG